MVQRSGLSLDNDSRSEGRLPLHPLGILSPIRPQKLHKRLPNHHGRHLLRIAVSPQIPGIQRPHYLLLGAASTLSFSLFLVVCEGYCTILIERQIRRSNSEAFRLLRPYLAAAGVKKKEKKSKKVFRIERYT